MMAKILASFWRQSEDPDFAKKSGTYHLPTYLQNLQVLTKYVKKLFSTTVPPSCSTSWQKNWHVLYHELQQGLQFNLIPEKVRGCSRSGLGFGVGSLAIKKSFLIKLNLLLLRCLGNFVVVGGRVVHASSRIEQRVNNNYHPSCDLLPLSSLLSIQFHPCARRGVTFANVKRPCT